MDGGGMQFVAFWSSRGLLAAGRSNSPLAAHEALALTKMDWNNDALYGPVPFLRQYVNRSG
jgi:hypothetical protein